VFFGLHTTITFPQRRKKTKKEKRKPLFRWTTEVSRFLRYFYTSKIESENIKNIAKPEGH